LERIVADPIAAWLLTRPQTSNVVLELDFDEELRITEKPI
jgi:hypothetical protein